MLSLLDYIRNRNDGSSYALYSLTFQKYLIISCVSLLEKIMALQIRNTIDRENIDISSIELRTKYEKMLKKYPRMTEGECVSIQSEFSNSNVINSIATCVLKGISNLMKLKWTSLMRLRKLIGSIHTNM